MHIILACIMCLLGVYAGRRRAMGREWKEIVSELYDDASSLVSRTWRKIRELFVRGGSPKGAEGGEEALQ